MKLGTSDDALVATMPGFENGFATVNGIQLHFVTGGSGTPLILLPGHPETWWGYHKIMPALAKEFRVIAVDMRGMGSSSKPDHGYTKKSMAEDIYQLVRHLGHDKVNIAGHDIGAMVAFAFAANHPEATIKLAMLDVPHPDENLYEFRMLPREGSFGHSVDAGHPIYPWWFAFHQVEGLPERLLAGDGMRHYIAWLFDYLLDEPSRITPLDLAVYGNAYSSPEGIRAGHAWYRAWPRDIEDHKGYGTLHMPVLGIGAEHAGFIWLKGLSNQATDFRLVKIADSGHFIVMEQPEAVAHHMLEFFRN